MKVNSGHRHAVMSLAALCIMCGVYTGLVFNTISLYMEPVITEFPEISRTQFAMILTFTGATNAVLSLFAFGPLAEKLKLRRCIILGAVSICVALVLFANIHGLREMYIGGLFLGFGITFEAAATVSLGVTIWFAKRTATMISIPIACGFVAGIVFPPLAGGWISAFGWRTSFYITLAIAAGCSVIVAFLYRDNPQQVGETPMFAEEAEEAPRLRQEETGVTFRHMFKTPQFYCLSLAYFIAGVTIYSVMINMAIFSADYGFDSATQGRILSVIFAATAVVMIPAGMIADRLGTKVVMSVCFVSLIAALLLLMQNTLTDMMLYAAAVFIGIAYVGTNGPASVSVREGLGTREFSKKMPVILGFMFAGISLGNPILQLFYDIGGSYRKGFQGYIVLSIAALLLLFQGTKPAETQF